MTTVHTLASGSSGNALVLSCGDTHLLVDAGISCRRITVSLRELGLTPEDLDAVFITHTHSDHTAGLQTLLKRSLSVLPFLSMAPRPPAGGWYTVWLVLRTGSGLWISASPLQ